MPETAYYWRVHVRVDEDPLSTLTITRAREDHEDAADLSAEAVRVYTEILGLPETWTVHVEVSTLVGPEEARDRASGDDAAES